MPDPMPTKPSQLEELKVTGNLMTLQPGLYCLVQHMGTVPPPQDGSGLPGIRVSVAPRGRAGGSGQVSIRGLHEDGWLGMRDGAVLVRVEGGAAEILVTVYQSQRHPADAAPRLQVVPITNKGPKAGAGTASAPQAASRAPAAPALAAPAPAPALRATAATATGELVAHIQRAGDVGVALGDWIGTRGSGQWIEGFSISPHANVTAGEIEYQAVLGRGWLSPWVSDGKFCGSRGMSLPLLGLNLRLRGDAAGRFACTYNATFVDGTRIGPVQAGQTCEAPSLAPLEAFQVILRPLGAAATTSPQRAARAPAASRAPARKAPVKKAGAKKAPAAKSPAKKTPAKKSSAKSPAPARKRGR